MTGKAPAPVCSICKREQVPLPHPTDRQALPVFVCAEKTRLKAMPCDGYAFDLSKRTD